jgi:phage terminase large subunit-like protein
VKRRLDWSTACPDWEKRIVEGRSLIPFAPLFPAEAASALEVFKALRVVDVQGSPTMGEICRPWITDFVASVFGAYDPEGGRRLISEFFLDVAKKNFKSGLAAGIMLTALVRNWRQTGEFFILSPTIEIANNSYYPARDMVRADEELADLFHVQDHIRTITHRNTGAFLKVIAADAETVGGKKGIGVLIDELWLFGKRANADNMLREATGGQASRPEGFTVYLTTKSDEPPAGVYKAKLDYARGVRDGRIDDKRFLPVIYEHPAAMVESGEHRNPRNFYITNPNLGASVDEEFLQRGYRKAEEEGEQALVGFLAKHANVEVGLALRSNRWGGADFWEANAERGLSLESLLERSEVVVIGVDGGGLDDLLGASAIGRETGTGRWLHWAHAWAHPIVLERNKATAPRLRDFADAGELTLVRNVGDDVEAVAKVVAKCEAAGVLDRVGVDPAGIGAIVDALVERGIDVDRIVGISQGWKMTGAIKTTERRLAASVKPSDDEEAAPHRAGMSHGGSRLMAWCVGNAKVEPRGNAIVITKQTAGQAKIDPLMATFNAVALMAMNPQPRRKNYEIHVFG